MSTELTLQEAALAWAQGKKVEAIGPGDDEWGLIRPLGEFKGVAIWMCGVFASSFPFRFRLAPEPPAIGTPEWANSLPEGTKVRHKNWSGDRWASRSGGVNWFENTGSNCGSLLAETGWELYTEPPTKKWRPWTPEEVPVGCVLVRLKLHPYDIGIIIASAVGGMLVSSYSGGISNVSLSKALETLDCSVDNKRTWLPCGVEVSE